MARGEVRFRLVLDSKGFTDGIKAAKNEANAMANDLSSKLGKAGSVLSAMGPAGLAAAAGVGALATAAGAAMKVTIDAVSAAAKYADAMAALEAKTGLSKKSLQDFEVAAKLGNSSLEAVASAVNKMQKGIVDGSENFKKLGLNLADLRKQSPEGQFQAVAKAIESINDPAQKAAARVAIFGKSGNDLAGVLTAAADGATLLGGALSDDALNAAADLADKTDLLNTAWDRVVMQFGAAVAQSPELQKAMDDITQALVDMAEMIGKLTPQIVAMFDKVVIGARLALNAAKSLATAHLDPIGAFNNLKGGSEQIMMDAMFTDVSGGSSSTGIKPGKPRTFGGGGGEDLAAKRKELLARVLQDQRKQWADWQQDQYQSALQQLEKLKSVDQKWSDDIAKELNERSKAYDDMSKAMVEKAAADEERMRELRFRANQEWVAGLTDVASALAGIGDVAGGAFGTLIGLGGAAVQVFANLKDKALQAASNTQKVAGALNAAMSIMQGPGGAKGALSGAAQGAAAGAAFGGIGAVIGGVAGGILGLFGGPSKAEKQAEQQKQIKDTISKMSELMEKAKALKMDILTKGVAGLGAMFGYLGSQTEMSTERLERMGRFGVAIFNDLRKNGMSAVEAFKAMGPALDKALEAFSKNGGTMNAAFANLLDFRKKVTENEGLVSGVEGFNDVVGALPLNKDSIVDVQAELKAMYDDLINRGFTADQALSLLAPSLLRIRDGAREGRYAIDETTGSLIDMAETGGHFDNIEDPMKELVEVQKMMLELWAAIAHMQGVTLPASLRSYLDEINRTRNAVGSIPTPGGAGVPIRPGGAHNDFPTHEGEPGHAASGLHTIMGRGPLSGGGTPLVAHPGEEVYIGPSGGRPRGPMGGGVGPIVLTVDGKVWAQHNIQNTRRNRFGTASQTRRYLGR